MIARSNAVDTVAILVATTMVLCSRAVSKDNSVALDSRCRHWVAASDSPTDVGVSVPPVLCAFLEAMT